MWKDFYYSKSNYIHNVYLGILTTIAISYPKVRIYQFDDDKQFINFLILLETKLTEEGKSQRPILISRKAKSTDEIKENCLAQIPGVGLQMSKKLLSHFGSISNITDQDEKDLQEIEKLGKVTAEKIVSTLTEIYHKNGNENDKRR